MESILGESHLHQEREDGEPCSFTEADEYATLRAAMEQEMEVIKRNNTWELADLPAGHQAITLKWVFKLKKDEAGAVVKHKAHLVARGFM